ncbi:MAG: hypothetical protein Q9214_004639, partial [Letrouitia sp. 1 TL-2023]
MFRNIEGKQIATVPVMLRHIQAITRWGKDSPDDSYRSDYAPPSSFHHAVGRRTRHSQAASSPPIQGFKQPSAHETSPDGPEKKQTPKDLEFLEQNKVDQQRHEAKMKRRREEMELELKHERALADIRARSQQQVAHSFTAPSTALQFRGPPGYADWLSIFGGRPNYGFGGPPSH